MAAKGFFKSCYLHLRLLLQPLGAFLWSLLQVVNTLLALAVVGITIYGLGFQLESQIDSVAKLFYWAFSLFLVQLGGNLIYELAEKRHSTSWWFKFLAFLFMLVMAIVWLLPNNYVTTHQILIWFHNIYLLSIITIVQACIHLSAAITHSLRSRMSPTWIFVSSFALLCFIGSGLLMLPRCTTTHISFIDAIFTSVSAVCVTGLTTIDIATNFTLMGKAIIGLLIQIGGIGIMTFTSFFGLFFIGSRQGQNRMAVQSLMIKDLVDPEKGASQIFKTLWHILLLSFGTELVGAIAIFYSTDGESLHDFLTAVFFAISAFCNAGMSTVEGGLMAPTLQFNYAVHMVIAILIIVGGLGFPIIFNLNRAVFLTIRNFLRRLVGRRNHYHHIPHLVSSNTIIVLIVSAILLVGGTLLFYFIECKNSPIERTWYENLMTAFFMSATTRSGGFSTVSMDTLSPITILWIIVFMWIGASPMSTGGGIKTPTLGIAFLNIWNTLRGRNFIEIRHRRISEETVNRAFVIIFGSLIVGTIGLFCLMWFEPEQSFIPLLFETISASSLCGLSLGVTSLLTESSKIVLIILMFIGRVGFITLLSTIIRSKTHLNYQYPTEIIPIN